MENPKATANTLGHLISYTKETSNKVSDKDKEYGKIKLVMFIKVIFIQIKNMGMESINGVMEICIKESLIMISGKEMES